MTTIDNIKSILGPVDPVGESEKDIERLRNLKNMCNVVDSLLFDINKVYRVNANAPEDSKRKAAIYAAKFIELIKADYE